MTKSSHEGLMALRSLALAEDHSYVSMMTAQFIQWNGLAIRWILQKKNLVHIHVPTANNLNNIGSAMHEKVLNLTTRQYINNLSPRKTYLYTKA